MSNGTNKYTNPSEIEKSCNNCFYNGYSKNRCKMYKTNIPVKPFMFWRLK